MCEYFEIQQNIVRVQCISKITKRLNGPTQKKREIRGQKRLSTEYCSREFRSAELSRMNRGFEMFELRKAQRLRGGSDAVVVPVEVVADRVNCAPDVHLRYGSHHDAKLEVAPVTCLESALLTFAHLVLISCVHEICIHEAHDQRESGLRNETAETVRYEDATRVNTKQFSESEVERRSATTWLVLARQSSSIVSLPLRLNNAELQFEMQRSTRGYEYRRDRGRGPRGYEYR